MPAWSYSLADNRGLEGQALVKDGVVFLTDHEKTVAVDALTGREIWKTMVEYPPETTRVVCCGIVNRGAALFDGKLYRTTLDANVIALDAKTGKEVWRTKSSDPKDGYSMTVAPLVANGIVIAGVAGAEYGIRGYLEGFDAQTGKSLWRTYTIPAKGEPGSETWPGDTWKQGGGIDLGHRLLRSRSRSRSTGAPAIRRRGIRSTARGTISTPTPCWRFSRRPARWSGTSR